MQVSERQPTELRTMPCQYLKGVGPKGAVHLARLDIHTVQDLLFHLPHRYQDRTRIIPIRALQPGEHVVIEGTVESVSFPKGGRTRLICYLRDVTGRIALRFFYISSQQRMGLQPGTLVRCFGEVRLGSLGCEMIHPEYKVATLGEPLETEEHLTPIYPTTEGLSQASFRKWTDQALQLLKETGELEEILPRALLQKMAFSSLKEALCFVHRPPADVAIETLLEKSHVHHQRLIFEELLAHRLSLLQLKDSFQIHEAYALCQTGQLAETFQASLPFRLTGAQLRVAADIFADLKKPHPMLRLIQGDVGSGKTVVAALAMLQAIESGYQAALLAPTELLAEQHYRTMSAWFEPLNIKVTLLSGQQAVSARREKLAAIQSDNRHIVIGTHAIFQKSVTFSRLALIVVDEQHRFGVEQRAMLREKGYADNKYPHQLIMTATPIPRTLAMSVYADLDYSVIDELPPGRTPVTTTVISNARRDEIFQRIHQACSEGRQVYWVCTLIEESEVLQCQAAENTALSLQATFPDLKLSLIHGRLKSDEKNAIMQAFKQGDIQLLVATTVIEVGVDVPNASVMVIENAERLGLAQLHQLRGRVGRGSVASHCVLMYQTPLSAHAKERLAAMRETTDGFKIAQKDLEIRGPGEVLGTRQTGDIDLLLADLLRDSDLLPAVSLAADDIQAHHRDVIPRLIQRWIGRAALYGHV